LRCSEWADYLFEAGSAQDLGAKILMLYRDGELRTRLSEKSAEICATGGKFAK
jgi:hypothetical protein